MNRLRIAEEAAAGGISPLEVMLRTMREQWELGTEEGRKRACEIAKDAAPYVHPRLSTIEQNTTLRGDTLSQLMAAIDGRTTGIATGAEEEKKEPTLQ
jgi:hypothetical protein